NDEVEEEEDTIGNEHGSEGKSLKRKRNVYMFSQKFDSYSDSIKHLKSDFVNSTSCQAKLYILCSDFDTSVSIYLGNFDHDHSINKAPFGINALTKELIENLYKSNLTTATAIRNGLRDRINPLMPKVLDSDPDVINKLYVPEIEIPNIRQINNYLQQTLRSHLFGLNHGRGFTHADLENWASSKLTVPDNDHTPFVIDYSIQVNDRIPSLSKLKIVITTKKLLEIAMKTKHICADATYKLMWHNLPVLIIGTTDTKKRFFPFLLSICSNETHEEFCFIFSSLKKGLLAIFNFEYKPDTLIADGAEAITNGFMECYGYSSVNEFNRVMCWFHMKKKVEQELKKNFGDESLIKKIEADVDKMHYAFDSNIFFICVKLFMLKWKKMEGTDKFLDYFKKEWIESTNCGWFEGKALNCPSTNNALESINGKLKLNTLRKRMAFSVFLTNAYSTVSNWSMDTVKEKIFCDEYDISGESWSLAYSFLTVNDRVIKKVPNSTTFLLTKKEFKDELNMDYAKGLYSKLNNDFDQLVALFKNVRIIKFNKDSWVCSSCTCSYYLRNYFCYHLIVVAVVKKLVEIPNKYKKCSIEPKAKRGRKANAAKALVRQ
ncbi:hypothetical protein BpHYR1_051645, partial [Brachionus plicatilis]